LQQSPVERAEHILKASGASITHAPGDRAFYRPATDSIHLPDRGQFPAADNYYATALHELGHNAVTRIMPHGAL
jgi:putative DNA primase/helicase